MDQTEPDAGAIVVFDGVCVLCNGWVDLLLKHDVRGRYRFAAMQSAAGQRLLRAHGLEPDDPASFLLLDGQGVHTDSDAVLRVLAGLGGTWTAARLLRVLPRAWRDALYRGIARNRYRWFGRRAACRLPGPGQQWRFIDE